MAISVRSVSDSAAKLVQRAQAAAGEYASRAAASGDKWVTNAQAGKTTYQQAITQGNVPERWARGIVKAGAAGYVSGITQKGANRFSQGVTVGQAKYAANVEPYFSVIAGLTLPARQPRGSAANLQRVAAIDAALNAKRLALLGVTV